MRKSLILALTAIGGGVGYAAGVTEVATGPSTDDPSTWRWHVSSILAAPRRYDLSSAWKLSACSAPRRSINVTSATRRSGSAAAARRSFALETRSSSRHGPKRECAIQQAPDVLRARPDAFEIALERVDDRRIGNEDRVVVLAGEPRPGEVARTGAQHRPIDGIGFQMHENALAFDPRDDIGMGEQRLDEPAARGSVLGELRLVQIESDEDAALRRVGQRLDDSRVGQNISRHIDGQLGAANLPRIDALKVFARRIVDLPAGTPRPWARSPPKPLRAPSRPHKR